MSIQQLSIQRLRNLSQLDIQFGSGINLLYGLNASGKTSILESIHMLALGRSFRSLKLASVVAQNHTDCLLFAKVQNPQGVAVSLGMNRRLDGDHSIRLNGEKLSSIAELASLLPIQLIDPNTAGLIEAGPSVRRQYLDWGVYHHNASFFGLWKQAQRLLKQRNSALKCGTMNATVRASFDPGLVEVAEQLNTLRAAYLKLLEPVFFELLAGLVDLPDLKLGYYSGWSANRHYADVLEETLERDLQLGYTQRGPQRADIKLTLHGVNAVERLSRGQQKLVVVALKLAQGKLLSEAKGRKCIFLVDDLAAELDWPHRKEICQQLVNLDTQVFVTSVGPDELTDCWPQEVEVSMFHVKHGQVSQH
ncbi:MAG: DNA replication/repair protein RecF [Gammaproteobacteria bacterium]|nr:DNA replication/repair protein RecF [Gammaproteobacteria bacterium]